jgi:hypothetical protein
MRRALVKATGALCLAVVLCLPGRVIGGDLLTSCSELGLRFAYGSSNRGHVDIYSFQPRWGTYLIRPGSPLLARAGLSFVVEGTISITDSPQVIRLARRHGHFHTISEFDGGTGSELGLAPMLKLDVPLTPSVLIFLEAGAGVILENIDSPAIPHTFNFSPQAGAGFEFKLMPRLGAVLAYRFRHVSNAGLYSDNPAFNANFVQTGLTYRY